MRGLTASIEYVEARSNQLTSCKTRVSKCYSRSKTEKSMESKAYEVRMQLMIAELSSNAVGEKCCETSREDVRRQGRGLLFTF